MAELQPSLMPSEAAAPLESILLPTAPTAPTTFHSFPKLPREIQDRVWTLALDAHAPRAYHVNLTANPTGPNGRTIRWGLRRVRQPGDPQDENTDGITRNVMTTNFLAREIAKLRWQLWEPQEPFSLEDRVNIRYPRGLTRQQSPFSDRLVVDASRDLMILSGIGNLPQFPGCTELRLPHRFVGCPWNLRESASCGNMVRRFNALLPLFPELKVVYILVEDLPFAKSFLNEPGDSRKWLRNRYIAAGRRYLRRLERESHVDSSQTFRFKDRLYYQIAPEEFSGDWAFMRLFDRLENVTGWHREDRPALRFMAWRNT